jgi:hypothetical protein
MDDHIEDYQTNYFQKRAIINLVHLKEYVLIDHLVQKYHVDLNFNDDGENIISTAIQNFDYDGINYCISKGATKNLNYASRLILKEYKSKPEETLKMIDYLFTNGASTCNIFHYSLAWNYPEINQYLFEKWKHKLDLENIQQTIEMCGRFGSYNAVKFAFEHYNITQDDLNKCLKEAAGDRWDTCYPSRYNLIQYLVEKGAILSNEIQMKKVTDFLKDYSIDTCEQVYLHEYFGQKDEEEE